MRRPGYVPILLCVILLLASTASAFAGNRVEQADTATGRDGTLSVTMYAFSYGVCSGHGYGIYADSGVQGSDGTQPAVYQSRSSFSYNNYPDPGSGGANNAQTSYAPLDPAGASSSVSRQSSYNRAVSLGAGTVADVTIGFGTAELGDVVSTGSSIRIYSSVGSFTCSEGIFFLKEATCTLEATWSPLELWHDIHFVDDDSGGCGYYEP